MKFLFFFFIKYNVYDKVYFVIYLMYIICIKVLLLYKSVGFKILYKLFLWYILVFVDLVELKIKYCIDLYFRVIVMKNLLIFVCFYLLFSIDCFFKILGN